ncbi:MAG TPA: hypothetical protein VKB05_00905 [Pyrinomonadaceae bacterium]|nr:hypothetical protein [Pyrinomonadaceae bacterium]
MTDEHITAYLLDELTEQETEQFEEQCFGQDEWPAELQAAEQDLIDAYLRNELTSARKRRFEERYLTTDARKARVLAAKTLHETLCPVVQPKSAWTEWLRTFLQRPLVPQTAIAILVVAVVIVIILVPRSPQTFTKIELAMSTSDRSTGPESEKVSVPLSTEALEIHLKLPEPSANTPGYRVQLENVNGPIGDLKIESQNTQFLVVTIPANRLSPGTYLLRLFNKNELVSNYLFTAEEVGRTR